MKFADRLKEVSAATSTETVTLGGASAGYRTLASAIAAGDLAIGDTEVPFCVEDSAGNWELSFYTITSSTLLTRTAIDSSSNAGAAVTFPAGTKSVFCSAPASFLATLAATRDIAFSSAVPLMQAGQAYMPQTNVTGPLTFTAAAGAVRGALAYLRLVADGTNTPNFSAFKEWGGSQGYDNRTGIVNEVQFFYDGYDYWHTVSQQVGAVPAPAAATAVTLTGPTSGVVSAASSNFNVGVSPGGGTIPGTVTVTPSSNGGGGTFTPTSVALTTASPTATFTYTPASTGAKTISVTNNGGLTNPSSITYTATSSATVPGAPTIGTATAGDGYVDVAFTAPASDGGSPITGYTATLSTGETNTGASSPIRVTAANGTARTANVKATNGVGTGAASAESNSVTPAAAPAETSSIIALTNLANGLTHDGGGEYSGGTAGVTGTAGRGDSGTLKIPANTDGWISIDWVLPRSGSVAFGLDVATGQTAYSTMDAWFWMHSDGSLYQGQNTGTGTIIAGGVQTPAAGVRYRLRRASGTLTAEMSLDSGATWTVKHTFAVASTGALYAYFWGAYIHQPRGSGLA